MSWEVFADPGKDHVALASFWQQRLMRAQCFRAAPGLVFPNTVLDVTRQVRKAFPSFLPGLALFRSERPIRRGRASRVRPEDLMDLCFMVGAVAQALQPDVFEVVDPSWKGSIKKKIMTERIKSKLSPQELAVCVTADHNTFDGVGIGLEKYKRVNW